MDDRLLLGQRAGLSGLGRSLDPVLGRLAVVMITGYQRYVSPHKGYACAHRVRHGGDSCSEYARKVFAAEGCLIGLAQLRARFRACRAASLERNGRLEHPALDGLDGERTEKVPPSQKPANSCVGEQEGCCDLGDPKRNGWEEAALRCVGELLVQGCCSALC